MRAPVADGSIVDLVVELSEEVTAEELNETVRVAASGPFSGIVEYTEAPVVSSDIIGNPHSSIFDAGATDVLGANLVKTLALVRQRVRIFQPGGRPHRTIGEADRLIGGMGALRRWSARFSTKCSSCRRFLTS